MFDHPAVTHGRAVALIVGAVALLPLFAAHKSAASALPHPTPRQVERFWTPRRMAAARPLEMTIGRDGRAAVHFGPRHRAAHASYSLVETPEAAPYAWNGRLYVMRGGKEGFCSATAIDSASRRLVLTAGHCVNSGPRDSGRHPALWSSYLEFVPGFNLGAAPYGTFALSGKPRALPQWTRDANPDFDLGAFLTEPNAEGVALADAVGGGAEIVTDLPHKQRYETFGYPGATDEQMRTCVSGFAGHDPVTEGLPGPSTVAVRCDWAPGASGGGWMIDGGREIDGLNSYITDDGGPLTFGPYFSATTVGRLVADL
ncbi:MAG TPA: hypothetical protein VGI17_07050 [Solirubrobacterales bacterium]|jgi:hypothetical protein